MATDRLRSSADHTMELRPSFGRGRGRHEVATHARLVGLHDRILREVLLVPLAVVEKGAGETAGFPDSEYTSAGATIADDPRSLYSQADIVLKVRPPSMEEVARMRPGQVVVSLFWPAQHPDRLQLFSLPPQSSNRGTGPSLPCRNSQSIAPCIPGSGCSRYIFSSFSTSSFNEESMAALRRKSQRDLLIALYKISLRRQN